jgi:FkbM family methyltransferase
MIQIIMNMFYRLLLEMRRNRPARMLCSNRFDAIVHPGGWEPEVVRCLCEGKWDGPVWDVGGALGKLAHRVAERHPVYVFEPNYNMLYFLSYNLRTCGNVVIVPCALTLDGKPFKASYEPDFHAPPTGPQAMSLSVAEALEKFGRPGVIKIDIEGGEYELLKSDRLAGIPLLIEWHGPIPERLPHWDLKTLDDSHSLLTPRNS